ncbi:hypothetical protein R1flu_000468 [Riccia fluitans]|uniref:Uncharacterized protein n=1 Tax=Riccia fluitans TaxID=41844 RepID=A0ABD1Y0H9_9MARC
MTAWSLNAQSSPRQRSRVLELIWFQLSSLDRSLDNFTHQSEKFQRGYSYFLGVVLRSRASNRKSVHASMSEVPPEFSVHQPSPWPEPSRLGEGALPTSSLEVIQYLRGCKLQGIQFDIGVRLEPSSVVLELNTGGEEPMPTKVIMYDRSGCHYVNGEQRSLDKIVRFLQGELKSQKCMTVEDIKLKELQEESGMWRAFIHIKLTWEKHTLLLGDLTDDVGTGICPLQKLCVLSATDEQETLGHSATEKQEIPGVSTDLDKTDSAIGDGSSFSQNIVWEPIISNLRVRTRLPMPKKTWRFVKR